MIDMESSQSLHVMTFSKKHDLTFGDVPVSIRVGLGGIWALLSIIIGVEEVLISIINSVNERKCTIIVHVGIWYSVKTG